jgi:hypothetical protein
MWELSSAPGRERARRRKSWMFMDGPRRGF